MYSILYFAKQLDRKVAILQNVQKAHLLTWSAEKSGRCTMQVFSQEESKYLKKKKKIIPARKWNIAMDKAQTAAHLSKQKLP